MFYVSDSKVGMYAITDTKDNVKEWYTKEDILNILSKNQITIHGVTESSIYVTTPDVEKLLKTPKGTPLRIKVSADLDFEQCIYMGMNDGKFRFFDGQGLTGYYSMTLKFLVDKDNKIEFDFINNNLVEVSRLTKLIKQKWGT